MMLNMAKKAKVASQLLSLLSTDVKNRALLKMAEALVKNSERILEANAQDVKAAKARGVRPALLDRLILTEKRINSMSQCLRETAELPDPIGEIIKTSTRPNGLIISQIRVPLGVVAIIYESRPNVTSDIAGICLKSGNAVILRGGSDAMNSNIIIGDILREAASSSGVPIDAIQVVSTKERSATIELMQLREYIDVLIPRGGAELIKVVKDNAKVPLIEYGEGNTHTYVAEDADLENAIDIVINAKTQRPGVCNALDKLLVHEAISKTFLPSVISNLRKSNVKVKGCEITREIVPDVELATEEDWYKEYLDLIISVKVVKNLTEAINHINKYGTQHSDAILSASFEKAWRFIKEVDSATTYWNASIRFTDGNQFGLGAEVGISTQKLHARGPMGAEHMTTTKYFILGHGQIRE
jgi:glutamate-5-semialdehyde dehydrogenase